MKRLLIIVFSLALGVFSKGEDDAIKNYLDKITVGEPIEYQNLRLFPIVTKTTLDLRDYLTLDEAMDKGCLKIKEFGSGEVNFVKIKNNSKEMVFILTGEMITGAKQDRMIKEDVLLPPNSDWIKVAVYCVEHGRWTAVSPEFKSEQLVVPNVVRQRAKITESQTEVWDEVAKSQERLGIASKTGTVRANYEDERIQKEVAKYAENFERIPKIAKSTIGVVVTTGNRIICFDLFANNGLLKKLWKKLVKSYAMDALSGAKSSVDKEDINEFLETFEEAKYVSAGTPGLGKLVVIESTIGKGSALGYENGVVHMDFFPNEGTIDNGSGLRLDLRREQRLDER